MGKNYRASTGVDEFYYSEIDEATDVLTTNEIERIKFLQNIEIESAQEITRAYGDNKTAEMAVSNGDTTVSSAFHKLPIEDRGRLLGLEQVDGIYSYGSSDNPPYVACVFAKTHEDGSKEWVGLPKGIFTRPAINGQTKEDGTEFQNNEIEAQFMDREVEGFANDKSVLFAVDQKNETTNRDALFMKIFGKPYPITGDTPVPEGV
jgi:phi13 family phage major tail protein